MPNLLTPTLRLYTKPAYFSLTSLVKGNPGYKQALQRVEQESTSISVYDMNYFALETLFKTKKITENLQSSTLQDKYKIYLEYT